MEVKQQRAVHPSYMYAVQSEACPSLVIAIPAHFQEGKPTLKIAKEGQALHPGQRTGKTPTALQL